MSGVIYFYSNFLKLLSSMKRASITTKLHLFIFAARTGESRQQFLSKTRLFYPFLCNSTLYLSVFRAKVGELLPHVSSPKIHLQYAKAKEADGK